MKKHFSCLVLFLISTILVGCGDDTQAPQANANVTRFKINDTTWQINIPEGWTLNTPPPAGTILVAENNDQNIILAQKPGNAENLKNLYLTNLANNFFEFEILNETDTTWTIKGKSEASSPVRVFTEKILPVPGSQSHLIGVCSYEYWPNRTSVCNQVLQSWVTEKNI